MNVAIIPAGGKGTRFGGDVPKQFCEMSKKPLIIHTLQIFAAHKDINHIIIGVHADYINYTRELLNIFGIEAEIAEGGHTRQQTVYNCLKKCISCNFVIIHDAARPFVSSEIISANIDCVKKYGAVNTVIPVTDAIIQSANGNTAALLIPKDNLYHAQTPQSFEHGIIMRAHENAKLKGINNAPDDCGLCMDTTPVYLVRGSPNNIKITTSENLDLFAPDRTERTIL